MGDTEDLESQRQIEENGRGAEQSQKSSNEIQRVGDTRVAVSLSWRDLTLGVNEDRYILHGLSGYAEPGRLLAVMGPSGSGKSTLLDTLAGRQSRKAKVSGEILVNGLKAKFSHGTACYLAQDVTIFGTLTVYETLYYSAKLRFADSTTDKETRDIVDTALKQVGLQDAVNTRIGNWHSRGVSGGEKRRVNIAVELLTSPNLLFFDEPTSGLDSASSYHVIMTLKTLAEDGGRTILCSIHQPSSEVYELFDYLCLLSGGRQVFFGTLARAYKFFQDNGFPCPRLRSPSDHYLHCVNSDFDTVESILHRQGSSQGHENKSSGLVTRSVSTKDGVDKLYQAYASSEDKRIVDHRIEAMTQMEGPELDKKGMTASFIRQATYLTMRSFVNMYRDLGYFRLRLIMYSVLCVALGTIFRDLGTSYTSIQDRTGVFIFTSAFLSFMAIAGFPSFIEDMKAVRIEQLNGYSGVGAFVIANSLSSAPFIFLISSVSTAIIYPLVDFRGGAVHVISFLLHIFGCLMVSESIMMMLTSCVSNFLLGITLGAGITGLYIMVSGFFRLRRDMPKIFWRYPLFYMSYMSYGFGGLMQNEFQGGSYGGLNPGDSRISGGRVLREIYQIQSRSRWWNLAILFGMVLVYRALFYILLKWREKFVDTITGLASKSRSVFFRLSSLLQRGERNP